MAVPRSYRSIKRFAEAYSKIYHSDSILSCFSEEALRRTAANDGLEAIRVYNQFPLILRKKMKFTPEEVEELEANCKKTLEGK